MYNKVLDLIAVSNEIFKRYSEERSKTAQYEAVAQELAPKIARRLVEQDIIDPDTEPKVIDTLTKSASSAVELLHDVIKAIGSSGASKSSSLGVPYSSMASQPTTRYADIRPEYVEGFVIDVNKLR